MSNPHEETAAKLINPYGFQHVAQQPICSVPNFILFYVYLIDHQTVTNLNTIQFLIFSQVLTNPRPFLSKMHQQIPKFPLLLFGLDESEN
jgi:hypothetical protein